MNAEHVLVVDDSALRRSMLRRMLSRAGFEVSTARDGEEALFAVGQRRPDVVTLDINMPGMDGITCLEQLMREQPLPVVMVSSRTERGAIETLEALELGAVDYVHYPAAGGSEARTLETEIVGKVREAALAHIPRATRIAARLTSRRERRAAHSDAPKIIGRGGSTATSTADVVLIGVSTGGPAVLGPILGGLPAEFPVPIVIAQHIPASFSAHLARRLNEECALTVQEVDGVCRLEPGTVLLARGDADIVLARRTDAVVARMVPSDPQRRWHPSVERLVQSALSQIPAERIIAVQLTGMGDDGAAGMAEVRSGGGRTIAQSKESCVVFGMPGVLVALGGASRVLPAEGIAPQLVRWVMR